MQRSRVGAIAICLLVPILLGPRLFAEEDPHYSILGEGSFTLQTSALEKGNMVSFETDLQDLAAVVIEDDTAHRELVRVGTPRMEREIQSKRLLQPEAKVVVEAESIKGRFEQKIAYSLKASKAIRVTLTLSSGVEVPFVVTSRDSMANKKVTETFYNKDCRTVTLTCSGCSGTITTTCCTVATCSDCVACTITCGLCGGGGGGGCFIPSTPPQQKLVAIPLDGGAAPDLSPSSFGLRTTERSTASLLLMDEWAVLSYSVKPGAAAPHVEVLGSSSPGFGAAKSEDLERGARAEAKRALGGRTPSPGTVLVIEAPIQPLNSGFATLPRLRVSDLNTRIGTTPLELVVRADFAADNPSADRLQILYSKGSVPAGLTELLKERLEVEREPGARNRVIVYVKVRIDDTRLEASSLATVTPKGCCGPGPHCI
jgi:hypothetical protein